jgi:hypothetical protein
MGKDMTMTAPGRVYSYGTIGHTSSHHAFPPWQGPYDQANLPRAQKLNIPLCDPSKRGGRQIQSPDPDKFCGKCEAVMFGLPLTVPSMSALPPTDRQRIVADIRYMAEYLTSCRDPAALHAWRCWRELSKPLGGQR